MNNNKTEGMWEEISELFQGHNFQQDNYDRLVETGNHATLPKCRNCRDTEICLENNSPICKDVRKTLIKKGL